LKRISPEYVDSVTAFVWRKLRIPAFRCEPCRHKYFSILPLQVQQESEAGPFGWGLSQPRPQLRQRAGFTEPDIPGKSHGESFRARQ
jgi:hypothetical protein